MYSNSTCVKQPFSKFFSSGKTRETGEVWKTGSMEMPYLSVERYALSVELVYSLVIKKQNLWSLPWKSKGVVALVISFTVQSVKDAVCS